MAICFARQTVVHAEGGSSAVGLAAYVLRTAMTDEVGGRAYDFRKHGGAGHDLVHAEVFLPEGAPAAYADASALWNGATMAELTVDRKTGEVRYKRGAQLAWHMILAVPKELALEESAALVRRFIEERFGAAGVAVQWALHDDPVNPHAHLLVSTRRLTASGWGNKAREIAPEVRSRNGMAFVAGDERGELVEAWERFQNAWFRERGIDLRVDPKLAVRDTHVGVARSEGSERAALSAEAQAEAAERMRDPAELLAAAGRMRSVWTGTELARVARRNGLPEEEIADAVAAALAHEESVALLDAGTGRETGYWTTEGIRTQERDVLARAKLMASEPFRPVRAGDAAAIAERLTLTAEQRAVLMRETEGLTRIGAVQGRAGTGKTRTLGAIREAHERRGHRVVGLGPTNVVARSLAADGFGTAMTAHLALIHLRNGRDRWNARTVVIVDEAAMLDTDILDRVMLAADRAGARLLLVGDDRQLQSVQRGGLFAPVAALAGTMELRRVQRQKTAWQREASEAFAAGDIAAAVGAYADHDCLAWTETLDESRAALVAAWAEASARDPEASRFIYASTNAEVKRLNAEARAIRVERGEIGAGIAFRTARGEVHAAAGDRIQFHDTDRHAGIFNGVLGTIVSCSEEEIEVRTDGGAPVSFDPERFEGWALGYAGTVYRGQGKTQTEVFALYDHAFAWSPSTSYVALTRQTDRVTLHVPRKLAADRDALIRQMGRARRLATSLDFAVRDELPPDLREKLDRLADAEAALTAACARAEEADRAFGALPAPDFRHPETFRDRTAAAEQAHETRREVLSCARAVPRAAFLAGLPSPVDGAALEAAKTAEAEAGVRAERCRALEDARSRAKEAQDAADRARALPKEDAASAERHAQACREAGSAFDILAGLARDAGETGVAGQARNGAIVLKLEPLQRSFDRAKERVVEVHEARPPAPRTAADVRTWRASGKDLAEAYRAVSVAADAVAGMRERSGLNAARTAKWRARAADDREQAALLERRDTRLEGLEPLVEAAAAMPADEAAWMAAADAADRISPDLGKGLRERAGEAGRRRDLVLELAKAFVAPVTQARAAADAAIAGAHAAGAPEDALNDARVRSKAWEQACGRIEEARSAYEKNGSPPQAAAMEKELEAARNRQGIQDARVRAHGAVRDMEEKLDELETARTQLRRVIYWSNTDRKTQREKLEASRKVLSGAQKACRETIDAQAALPGSSPDADEQELRTLREEARRAREKDEEIDGELRRVNAVLLAILHFHAEAESPHPDWKKALDKLDGARRTDMEGDGVFTAAAQTLAAGYASEARALDNRQKTEARQRKEAAVREAAQQQRVSREQKKSESRGQSITP